MTNDEWNSVAYLMESCWKGEFDDERQAAYRVFLDRFSAEEVMTGLHAIAESGSPFLPAVPEIVQRVRTLAEPPVPGWTEVWQHMMRALRKEEPEAVAYLEGIHPMVARFLQAEGHARLRHEPLMDPDYGAIRQAEMRGRWEEFCEVARARLIRGRAIAAGSGRSSGLGPSRLDAVALVEGLRPIASAGELTAGRKDA